MDELVEAMAGLYQEPKSRRWYVVTLPEEGDRLKVLPWSLGEGRPRVKERTKRMTPASLIYTGLVRMGDVPASFASGCD